MVSRGYQNVAQTLNDQFAGLVLDDDTLFTHTHDGRSHESGRRGGGRQEPQQVETTYTHHISKLLTCRFVITMVGGLFGDLPAAKNDAKGSQFGLACCAFVAVVVIIDGKSVIGTNMLENYALGC